MNKKSTLALAVSALLAGHCGIAFADLESVRTFDIPPQPLASALLQFSSQADVQVVGSSNSLTDLATPGINGRYTGSEALRRLIGGNPVNFEAVTKRSVRILPQAEERAIRRDVQLDRQTSSERFQRTSVETSASSDSNSSATSTLRLAQGEASPEGEKGSPGADSPAIRLEEVVVTGSHIRGAQNLSSPVITFDREDIEASGYSTVQQLIQSIPQNVSNVSETTFENLNGGAQVMRYGGSGINLRGLGSESTLVLLNGRRISAAGRGNFVDVSLIPMSAIDRVEVLTDGASAIYGSDAVAGVVNFVLRDDFEGAETRLRYGSVTTGGLDELQVGQTLGHAWQTGNALISYEYFRRGSLDGADRDFLRPTGVLGDFLVIPGHSRQGVFATAAQRLSAASELAIDVFFSERKSANSYTIFGSSSVTDSDVKQYGGSAELKIDLMRDWQLRASGLINENASEEAMSGRGLVTEYSNDSRLWSIDVAADGTVGNVPGGEVRLALGGQFRNTSFDQGFTTYPARGDREIAALYAEARVPWVSAQNRRTGIERLEFTLAGRLEEYDDFGGTFDPKLGLSWAPIKDLNLRSTWGTSFTAPLLSQMNLADNYGSYENGRFHDGSGGTTPTLVLYGSGANLKPEEAATWTAGFDIAPLALPNAALSMTYFEIDYRKRIRNPFPSGYDIWGVLLEPNYAAVVTRNPDPLELGALLNRLRFVDCTDGYDYIGACNPSADEISAIVDSRVRNLASVRMSGLDLLARYGMNSTIGEWVFSLNGHYVLDNREQLVPNTPHIVGINDVWRPVDLRLRNSVSFTRGALATTATVNYTDGYSDRRSVETAGALKRSSVASWTTVDLTVQLDLTKRLSRFGLPGATLALSAINLLDRDPPFVANRFGLTFDGVNANPLGRFVSAQLTARWGH